MYFPILRAIHQRTIRKLFTLSLSAALAACAPIEPQPELTQPPSTATVSPTPLPSTPTRVPPTLMSPSPVFEGEPDPFADISIEALSQRGYGGGGIVLNNVIRIDPRGYTQYSMSYDSDGLTITGLINIPPGFGPFPVAICLHGYAAQWVYYPGYDSARLCDWLSERNYIGIMPDYRNYGSSDQGPNPFRVGYAIDIMNLIAQLGSLPTAAPEQVGLIGHSLGGEIAMWPMVISDEVDAIVLYASMSGDVARNWQHRWAAYPIQRDAMNAVATVYGRPEDDPEGYARVSPATYLERVRMPVAIHHGNLDDTVPFWWSEELAGQLSDEGKDVTFFAYEGEGHGFTSANFPTLMERTLAMFDEHVRGNTNSPD